MRGIDTPHFFFRKDMDLSINTREIDKLEAWLAVLNDRAIPFATKSALNSTAFLSRKVAQKFTIPQKMTLRNKHAVGSVRVEMAKTLRISKQESKVGSIVDYMADQEFGAIKPTRGKEGVRITTNFAAGQPDSQKPRTKVARGANKIRKIQLKRGKRKGKSRKQRNLIAIAEAGKSNNKYVFLNLGRRKGIFRVVGRSKTRRIKMVHDLTKPSVKIPRNPWLQPATKSAFRLMPKFYIKALNFQIDRIRR